MTPPSCAPSLTPQDDGDFVGGTIASVYAKGLHVTSANLRRLAVYSWAIERTGWRGDCPKPHYRLPGMCPCTCATSRGAGGGAAEHLIPVSIWRCLLKRV